MLMNSSRRQQLLQAAENQNNFPALYLRPSNQQQITQKPILENKESDFIKRIKRAKSIMIAHKNRKQKNVLNAYFMDSSRRKKTNSTTIRKCSSIIISQPKPKSPELAKNIQKFQNYLFPPVHSSMQICLNSNKKMKSRQMRIEPTTLSGSVDIGAYLAEQMKNKTSKKQVKIQLNFLQKSKSLINNGAIHNLINEFQQKRYESQLPVQLKISSQDIKIKAKLHKPFNLVSSLKRKNQRYNRRRTEQPIQQRGKVSSYQKLGRWQYLQPQQYNIELQTQKL